MVAVAPGQRTTGETYRGSGGLTQKPFTKGQRRRWCVRISGQTHRPTKASRVGATSPCGIDPNVGPDTHPPSLCGVRRCPKAPCRSRLMAGRPSTTHGPPRPKSWARTASHGPAVPHRHFSLWESAKLLLAWGRALSCEVLAESREEGRRQRSEDQIPPARTSACSGGIGDQMASEIHTGATAFHT